MQISVIQNGRLLRTIDHEGQTYVEAPTSGEYKLRVYNNTHCRRLAIVSVDGVNVVNGQDASYEGGGYVLNPWQTVEIPGFRRDDGTVAAFKFTKQGGSYAAQTERGTKNVGVIGLAVFDEKVLFKVSSPPVVVHEYHHHHHNTFGGSNTVVGSTADWTAPPTTLTNNTSSSGPITELDAEYGSAGGPASADQPTQNMDPDLGERLTNYKAAKRAGGIRPRRSRRRGTSTKDVGTGYGRQVRFNTEETTFTRATSQPVLVTTLRYATRGRLESWGVPVEKPNEGPMTANPFPAAGPSVPAPPGWRG